MSEAESESLGQDVGSEHESELEDDPDLEFFINMGLKIIEKKSMRNVWNNIGPIWMNATDVLIDDDDSEEETGGSDRGSTSTTTEEVDPSYKPVYRIQDILKCGALWIEADREIADSVKNPILTEIYDWLRNKESTGESFVPESEPESEPEETAAARADPVVTSNLRLLLELPAELLVDIVQLALEHDPYINITISHVNTALRAFAFSFPVLWTTVDVIFPKDHILAQLERSGSSLLHVRVPLPLLAMDMDQGGTKLRSFGDLIQPHVARIASLEIIDTDAACESTVLSLFSGLGTFSNLERFDYRSLVYDAGSSDKEGFQLNYEPKMIRLQEVGVKTFRSIYSAQVLSLKVTGCQERRLMDLRDALGMMPSLQTLEISDLKITAPSFVEDVDLETTVPAVSLPHLRSLSLSHVPKAFLKSILDALQTPNLASATIVYLEPDGLRGYNILVPWKKPRPMHGMSEVALLPFISANPQLQKLDLCNCFMTSDMWTTAFESLERLEHLRIASSDVSKEALESLLPSGSSSSPVALPSLTHLTLDNEALDEDSNLDLSFIAALVKERWALYQQQQANGGNARTQVQALTSVVLRGWNASSATEYSELDGVKGYVQHLQFEPVRAISEDGEATDGEWESQSGVSWASGDQAVVDFMKQ